MSKKLCSILLAFAMIMLTITNAFAAVQFKNVDGSMMKIENLKELGFINGYEDGSLKLDQPIKRSEFAKVIVHAFDKDGEAEALKGKFKPFKDVDESHWANGIISIVKNLKSVNNTQIINGYPDGTFRPEENITYAEALKMLVCCVKADLTEEMYKNAEWPTSWVKWAIELGIIGADSDVPNIVDMNEKVTRGNVFTMFYNAFEEDEVERPIEKTEEKEPEKKTEDKKEEKSVAPDRHAGSRHDRYDRYPEYPYYPDLPIVPVEPPVPEVKTYSISIDSIENGIVSADKYSAEEGEIVTLRVMPNEGYKLDTLEVTDSFGNIVHVVNQWFAMPSSNVVVMAKFVEDTVEPVDFDKNNIKNIEIKSEPKKMKYVEGEKLDLSGLVVFLTDINDNYVEVPYSDSDFLDYGIVVEPKDGTVLSLKDDGKQITVSKPGVEAKTNPVEVKEKINEYAVVVIETTNGKVIPTPAKAEAGTTITLDIKPETGYKLEKLTVKDAKGQEVKVKEDNSFSMPASNVEVTATFNYTGDDVIPVPDPENPPVKPDGFVEVVFDKGAHGEFAANAVTKYFVNPKAGKTLKDITKPGIEAAEGWKFTGWDKADTEEIKAATEVTAQYKAKVVTEDPQDDEYVKVDFATSKGTLEGTSEYWVLKNEKVSVTAPTDNMGTITDYTFKAWDPAVKTTYAEDTTHNATFTYSGEDIVPQPGDDKPNVPDDFVLVEFKPGEHGTLTGTTKYWVNPTAGKTLADVTTPAVKTNEGWKFTGWDKADTEEIKAATEVTAQNKAKVVTTDPQDDDYVKVDFATTKGTIEGTKEYWVLKDEEVSVATPTVNMGQITDYTFKAWNPEVKTTYAEDTTHNVTFTYAGGDIVPQPGDDKPDVPDNFVLVEFKAGDNGTFAEDAVTKYWVNPEAGKTLADVSKPGVTANEGYKFTGWDKADTTQIKANLTVTAEYKDKVVTTDPQDEDYVKVDFATSKGTIEGTKEYWVLKNEKVSIAAPTVNMGTITDYTFKAWNPVVAESYSADQEHKATFTYSGEDIVPQLGDDKPDVPDDFVLVEFKAGDHGTLTGTTKYWVNPKAGKTLKYITKPGIEAAEGWKFTGWDKADTTEIKANLTVTATFEAIDYTITVDTDTNKGTVNVTGTPNVGKPIEIKVNPKEGYEVDGKIKVVDKDNNPITVTDGKFTMPASDVTITATFKQKEYAVSVKEMANGEVIPTPAKAVASTPITLDIKPATGYELDTIEAIDGEGTKVELDEKHSFKMPISDVTVKAIFKKSIYTVQVETVELQGKKGKGTGTVTVDKGNATLEEKINLNVKPDETSKVKSIKVTTDDGKTVPVNNNSFIMPASNVKVEVVFRKKEDISITFNEVWINDSYATGVPFTLEEDSIWEYSKETFNLMGNALPLKREGFEFLGWKTEDGRLITESFKVTIEMNRMQLYGQWKDLNQDEQDFLKEQFEEAFKTSVQGLENKNAGSLKMTYDNKSVTIYTDTNRLDITARNLIEEVKYLVNKKSLVKYNDTALNKGMSNAAILKSLVDDFAKIAGVDVQDLDYNNESQLESAVKVILSNLGEQNTEAHIKFTLKNDKAETTDDYTLKFHNITEMTDAEAANYDEFYDGVLDDTVDMIIRPGGTKDRNKSTQFNYYYFKDNNTFKIDVNTKYKPYRPSATGGSGFKTAIIHFLTGGWYPTNTEDAPKNMKVKKEVQKDLYQVKISQGEKSAVLTKEILDKIINMGQGLNLELMKPFMNIFMPEGEDIYSIKLGDFVGQEPTFEFTYIDENNKKTVITRTLTFGEFTE